MTPGRLRPTRRGVVIAVAVAIALVALWYLATPGPLRLGGSQLGPAYAVRAVAWSVAILGSATLFLVRLGRIEPGTAGLGLPARRRSWWEALALLPAVGLAMYLTVDPGPFRGDYPWPSTPWLDTHPSRWLLWTAGYAGYYLAYEAFFRGALLGWSERHLGRPTANVVQAVLSTLVHVGKPWPETLAALPAGLLFGWLRFRWRSVLPVALVHLVIGLTLDLVLVTSASP